jgi:uncharacterized protein YceK
MHKIAILLITSFALLSGCASQVMKSAENQSLPGLSKDKSRIVFMRSAMHGTVVRAGIYEIKNDKPQFLGVLANTNKFYNDITPGKHNFMSLGSGGVRFLTGNFKAGKTYYIAATPRGWPAINFSLYPFRGDGKGKFNLNSSDFTSMKQDTVLVLPSPESAEWGSGEQARADAVFNVEWTVWKNRPADFKAQFTIISGDGV